MSLDQYSVKAIAFNICVENNLEIYTHIYDASYKYQVLKHFDSETKLVEWLKFEGLKAKVLEQFYPEVLDGYTLQDYVRILGENEVEFILEFYDYVKGIDFSKTITYPDTSHQLFEQFEGLYPQMVEKEVAGLAQCVVSAYVTMLEKQGKDLKQFKKLLGNVYWEDTSTSKQRLKELLAYLNDTLLWNKVDYIISLCNYLICIS